MTGEISALTCIVSEKVEVGRCSYVRAVVSVGATLGSIVAVVEVNENSERRALAKRPPIQRREAFVFPCVGALDTASLRCVLETTKRATGELRAQLKLEEGARTGAWRSTLKEARAEDDVIGYYAGESAGPEPAHVVHVDGDAHFLVPRASQEPAWVRDLRPGNALVINEATVGRYK